MLLSAKHDLLQMINSLTRTIRNFGKLDLVKLGRHPRAHPYPPTPYRLMVFCHLTEVSGNREARADADESRIADVLLTIEPQPV